MPCSILATHAASCVSGNGRPACAGYLTIQGVNDLATTHPHLMHEWSPSNKVDPSTINAGFREKVAWEVL